MLSFPHFFSGKFNKGQDGRDIITPVFHWLLLLSIFAIVCFFVVIWHVYIYTRINRGTFFEVSFEHGQTLDTVDRERLSALIDYYKKRATNFADLEKNKPKTIDPSL